MKSLIVYATKYGATKTIAEGIASSMGNADLYDAGSDEKIMLNDYDCVVLGSPLTAGSIRKEIKRFISEHTVALQSKRLGIFLSGLQESDEEKYFTQNFPKELLDRTAVRAFLGGVFDPKKCGFLERKLIKLAAKIDTYTSTINADKIAEFARMMEVGM